MKKATALLLCMLLLAAAALPARAEGESLLHPGVSIQGDSVYLLGVPISGGTVQATANGQAIGCTSTALQQTSVGITYYCVVSVTSSLSDVQRAQQRAGLIAISQSLGPNDGMVLVAMGRELYFGERLTAADDCVAAIDGACTYASYGTELYQSIDTVLATAAEAEGFASVVFFTDGCDNSNVVKYTEDQVARIIQSSGMSVSFFVLLTPPVSNFATARANLMKQYAEASLGGLFRVPLQEDGVNYISIMESAAREAVTQSGSWTIFQFNAADLPRDSKTVELALTWTDGTTTRTGTAQVDVKSLPALPEPTQPETEPETEPATETLPPQTEATDPVPEYVPDNESKTLYYVAIGAGAAAVLVIVLVVISAVRRAVKRRRKKENRQQKPLTPDARENRFVPVLPQEPAEEPAADTEIRFEEPEPFPAAPGQAEEAPLTIPADIEEIPPAEPEKPEAPSPIVPEKPEEIPSAPEQAEEAPPAVPESTEEVLPPAHKRPAEAPLTLLKDIEEALTAAPEEPQEAVTAEPEKPEEIPPAEPAQAEAPAPAQPAETVPAEVPAPEAAPEKPAEQETPKAEVLPQEPKQEQAAAPAEPEQRETVPPTQPENEEAAQEEELSLEELYALLAPAEGETQPAQPEAPTQPPAPVEPPAPAAPAEIPPAAPEKPKKESAPAKTEKKAQLVTSDEFAASLEPTTKHHFPFLRHRERWIDDVTRKEEAPPAAPTAPPKPPVQKRACTVQLMPVGNPGASVYVTMEANSSCTLGRNQKANIILNESDTCLSGLHFELQWDGRSLYLTDRNSTNGTAISGIPQKPGHWSRIETGATVQAGNTRYKVKIIKN